jgi:cellulose synthase/poly-beta-1,6-N-acetylglucosamine synthase-like glycosyltransferase
MKLFFLVLARDRAHVFDKIKELESLGVDYRIICGERLIHPKVVYQYPKGKYAAINFGASLLTSEMDVVIMNDVDTQIHNFDLALQYFADPSVGLVFGTEFVKEGPQNLFFRILNPLRRRLPIAGSGELMLIRRRALQHLLPLKPCKAEDTYILFKLLELNYRVVFCEQCYAETKRTKTPDKEEIYKRRTVAGIYQALSYSNPPLSIRLFYILLPLMVPILLVLGRKGYYWARGILLGFLDFTRGDRIGKWKSNY